MMAIASGLHYENVDGTIYATQYQSLRADGYTGLTILGSWRVGSPLCLSVTQPNNIIYPTMSLDKNLFTLFFTPNKDHPNVIDLIDPVGTVHYRKQRVLTPEYKIELYGMYWMNPFNRS